MVSYVGSRVQVVAEERRRRHTYVLSFAFFAGVVLGIVALGVLASYLGRLFIRWSYGFAVATAVLSVAAGVVTLLAPRLRLRVRQPEIEQRGGTSGAFLYGLMFTIATVTTGAGPLLLLLTVAAAIGSPLYGALLSLFYGVGRGLPFLLMGVFAGRIGAWIARVERGRRAAEVVSGIALLVIGGYFLWLATAIR